jgi:hypothetical protein
LSSQEATRVWDVAAYHGLIRAPACRARAAAAIVVLACVATDVAATEGGASLYIPGLSVPTAGVLPGPGIYFDNTAYFYDAKLPGGRTTRLGGNIVSEVKIKLWADFATGLWVTPLQIFGGNLAFGVTVPFGEPDVKAGAIISGPIINRLLGRPLTLGVRDRDLNFGDPVVSSTIGWHSGNWHWKVGAAASILAGAYEPGELSNVALNRWVGDFSGALTFLDPALGIDLSAAAGFEINGRNDATDYRSGNAFHLDLSAMKFLTKELSVGVIASHYQQLTGDTGDGATLGPYKGRTTAVGGTLGYTFHVGHIPVSTRVKVLREVDVENRFQGTIGYLQISFPLWVAPHASPTQPVVAKF